MNFNFSIWKIEIRPLFSNRTYQSRCSTQGVPSSILRHRWPTRGADFSIENLRNEIFSILWDLVPSNQGAPGLMRQGPGERTRREGLGESWLQGPALPEVKRVTKMCPALLLSACFLPQGPARCFVLQMEETEDERSTETFPRATEQGRNNVGIPGPTAPTPLGCLQGTKCQGVRLTGHWGSSSHLGHKWQSLCRPMWGPICSQRMRRG